uniref:Uncharacterized protein n=1 Tax=Nelumbo nucifera TaxID=4432 RepID=A0A822XJ91_NELNU|nr:TPA_asm: hypothetical protein HUJ06_020519 [Nelumbo nucifera]
MHAQDLLINKSSHWQAVEAICKSLPEADIIPSLAFIIEPINTVDGSTFMVAPKKKKVLWIFDFVCKEKANGLYALLTTVNIVSQEQIVCSWWAPTILEKPEEIRILAMNISHIFMGASSSRRLGWLTKISLDEVQSCRISASVSWTCFDARAVFASRRRLMISSNKFSSIGIA